MKNETIPRLRFKGFTDNWINNIIGNLINVSSSKRVHQSEWTTHGVPFLRARNITAHLKGISLKDPIYISPKTYDEYSSISGVPSIGDLLAVGVGVNIGEPLLVTTTSPFYFKDGNIIWFHNDKFSKYFLYYYFFTNTFKKYIKATKELGAVPTYTIKSGKETPIKYPSLSEQQLIGKFFAKLDKLIQLQQEKVSLLKKSKQGYLQKLFPRKGESVPRLRFKRFHGAWIITKLGDLLRECKKQKISNPNKYDLLTVKLHFQGVVKTNNHPRVTQRSRPYYMRYPGELIIGKQNFQHGGFGLAPKSIQNCIASSAIWSFKFKNNINKYFLLNYMSNIDWLKHTTIYLNGTGQKEYGNKTFKNLKIKKPIINEQNIIGKFFMNLNNLLKFNKVKLNELKKLKRAYLQKMFC